ncbi:MAG: hypothetical protein ACKPKO_04015, partial [Candidatus Fonsibacter sp.]
MNLTGDLLLGAVFTEGASVCTANSTISRSFCRIARDLSTFDTVSLAELAVPTGVGMSVTGVSFLRLTSSFCADPSAGDFRRPKPTKGSDNRITLVIFRPKTTRETERLLRQFAFDDFVFLLRAV